MRQLPLLFKKVTVVLFVLLVAQKADAQLPAYLPANGLVAWYPFTGNANDSSGNTGNNGTVMGATLTTDRFGNNNCAYNFDGNTNYITGAADNFPTTERTVSLWYFTNDLGVGNAGRTLLGYGGGNCGTTWLESMDNYDNGGPAGQNTYEVQGHCGNQMVRYYYGAVQPNGAWHNWIITTKAGAGTCFYIDGALVKTDTTFINQTVVAGMIFVFGSEIGPNGLSNWPKGTDYNVTPINGKLDDIGIWSRALTPCEIQAVYSGQQVIGQASITAGGNTTFCLPDSVQLLSNAGSNYQWYNNGHPVTGATNQSYMANQSGNYNVTIGTGSCLDTSNHIMVTAHAGAHAGYITSPADTICEGTPASLLLNGNSPDSIQWQSSTDGITYTNIAGADTTFYNTNPLMQTTYYRAVVGKGMCADTTTPAQKLFVPPALTASFTNSTAGIVVNFTSTSVGNITFYSWDFGDGSALDNNTNPVHTFPNATDTFNVCLTIYDGSNCSYTFCKDVSIILGIETISASGNFNIYPSPFGNQLTIENKTGEPMENVMLIDVLGRTVYAMRNALSAKQVTLNTTTLPGGVYFLEIKTADGEFVKKVVKE